jgi:hypothetical protein
VDASTAFTSITSGFVADQALAVRSNKPTELVQNGTRYRPQLQEAIIIIIRSILKPKIQEQKGTRVYMKMRM